MKGQKGISVPRQAPYSDEELLRLADGDNGGRPTRPAAPSVLTGSTWDAIVCDVVVPTLRVIHITATHRASARRWTPLQGAQILARLSLAADGGALTTCLDQWVDAGVSLETLYREAFEPAARDLGGLWAKEMYSAAQIGVGLGRLQVEARRLSMAIEHPLHAIRPGHSILVASQPGEIHHLSATLSSELFWRDGWDVSCEHPESDRALQYFLHDSWFDVLDLSTSGTHHRDHRMPSLAQSVRLAKATSLNPALIVLVNGRNFYEQPLAHETVGADAACATTTDAVTTARRLLEALAARRPTDRPGFRLVR